MSEALKEALKKVVGKPTEQITIIKANGKREVFDPEKLRMSLLNSGASPEAAEKVLDHVHKELHGDMTSTDIYTHAYAILKEINRPLARSYSLRRAIMDLGPSGFPFEDFVAEVLKAKGFECVTRQTVLGGCVPHEIDVVAWNSKKLVMAEAKFHNELGTKSDLKVALYVKARFDDIRDNVYNYGGKDRPLDEGWLITNTKFSSTAIHYGVCQNLVMIGWNYPEQGNLQHMIEEEGLHPITCLTSLNANEKKLLLTANVVLCSSIKSNPNLLTEILGKSLDSQAVIEEVNELYK
jgi:hypothetical protein